MDSVGCPADQGSTTITTEPLVLEEVLRRFEAEAEHGVCHTGRYRCSYYAWGSGPPLVFIHGLADAARSFILPIARLAEQFRCIAYELPSGLGDGARLTQYGHAELVEDLFALLDHLGVRQSYLLGSSFGSTITLAALKARPERVPRAILQGGFARRPLALLEGLLARTALYWPGRMGHLPLRDTVLRLHHHAAFAARSPEVWRFFLDNCAVSPITTVARRALLMHGLDLRPTLPEIRQPVLLVCGEHDPLVGRDCEEALLQGLPSAGRVEFAGCGHFPYFTHPEALAEVVRRFLTPAPCSAEAPV
jgi:pimeloyl-ACP methyl ester carboxylesterase